MRGLWLGLAVIGVLASCGPRAQPQGAPTQTPALNDPAELVTGIYAPYLDADETIPRLHDAAPWSNAMRAALEAMMAHSATIGEPILDFDPLINAQDWRLSDVSAATESLAPASHATVRARFLNGDRREQLVYDLVWEDNGWKVDNVRGADWDLRAIATAR